MKKLDYSVVVVTFNPDFSSMIKTLYSIVNQRDVSFEIVVADDGSKIDYFDEIKEYFNTIHFDQYKLVKNQKNMGTVKNLISAIERCEGDIIKTISPGDLLIDEEILYSWKKELDKSSCKWSFGDCIYYTSDNKTGEAKIISGKASPQLVRSYFNNDDKKSRWNYLINRDLCIGAALICKKDIIYKYLTLIKEKIIYGEDNIYRIMMLLGDVGHYYKNNVVYYEIGSGISTSSNDYWQDKIKQDWNSANDIMISVYDHNDLFQEKLISTLKVEQIENKYIRKVKSFFIPGRLKIILKRKFFARVTLNTAIDHNEIFKVLNGDITLCK